MGWESVYDLEGGRLQGKHLGCGKVQVAVMMEMERIDLQL
jgi:hypothetical protein